jgi:hypothetical protein
MESGRMRKRGKSQQQEETEVVLFFGTNEAGNSGDSADFK